MHMCEMVGMHMCVQWCVMIKEMLGQYLLTPY